MKKLIIGIIYIKIKMILIEYLKKYLIKRKLMIIKDKVKDYLIMIPQKKKLI